MENGLAVLATVGATAPSSACSARSGAYHALVAIGMSGAGTLDRVAGPVGEALIMTGLGLAVAIPAVVAYNWLTRANRVLLSRLDAFAYEVHTFVAMGQPLATPTRASPACADWRRSRGGLSGAAAWPSPASDSQRSSRAGRRDQHGPADRRDAGAAGDLHRHRAAAHPRRQARTAARQRAGQPRRPTRSSSRSTRAARCTGTASPSRARTPTRALRPPAAAAAARDPPQAPTRPVPYKHVARTPPTPRAPAHKGWGFVSDPDKP